MRGMPFRQALGEAIRKQRLAKRLTLRQVSANGFVSMGHLSDVENGRKDGSSGFIDAVANGLGVEPYSLVIEAGYRMAESNLEVPSTPESLFERGEAWNAQYSDLKQ